MSEFDTTKARAAIFARIRTNQKRGPSITGDERAAADDYLRRHPAGTRPAIDGDLALRFRAMSERMASTVDDVATWDDAPAAVARYLEVQQLGRQAVAWSSLAHLDWAGAGMIVEARPPRRDESGGDKVADPLARYLSDVCTIPSNLAGHPAISVPIGVDAAGLPIGFQVMAPALGERTLYRVAAEVERLAAFTARPGMVEALA